MTDTYIVPCAWCKTPVAVPADAPVHVESHGICAACARTWGRDSLPTPNDQIKADIARFEAWQRTPVRPLAVEDEQECPF